MFFFLIISSPFLDSFEEAFEISETRQNKSRTVEKLPLPLLVLVNNSNFSEIDEDESIAGAVDPLI